MKIISAHFKNFRLLRDLKLDFSVDPQRNLTVIRAANETGKTTILNALQWALYGDTALPGKGENYRLHPIDWTVSDGKRVMITVMVTFEVTKTHRRAAGVVKSTVCQYRIIRVASEELSQEMDEDTWHRSPSSVQLFIVTDRGAEPVDIPEALIADELPPELREVFFTDGDRALSFIEADVAISTKRARVQGAIRSLLGLGIIENSIKHVQKSAVETNRQAKKLDVGGELPRIASRLEAIETDIAKREADLEDAKLQFANFDQQIAEVDRSIDAALQLGDREKLQKDMEHARRDAVKLDERIQASIKEHSALFRGLAVARDLLGPVLIPAFAQLEAMREKGKIPSATIPVLEDRLISNTCICGESLELNNLDGIRRREHIQHLIAESQRADEVQAIVTDLYYGSKALRADAANDDTFLRNYKKVVENRDALKDLRDEAGRKMRAFESQLDSLPDTDIQGLRGVRRDHVEQRDRFKYRQGQVETELLSLTKERLLLHGQRDSLLREQKKGSRILADLDVTEDIIQVLKRAYERITTDELIKVSWLTNHIFLEMIGADPEQGAIIKKAEISPEFDIIVYGPNRRTLNPDRDLNGASRRALTLAFILALTKVSEVEAPNVIDTPLGMMSGYVKRSVLTTAIRESSQLVLFLTHAEIEGCEEILDQAAGVVVTLTNPAHYPRMLVNDARIDEIRVLRCDCNHRSTCDVCARRVDVS